MQGRGRRRGQIGKRPLESNARVIVQDENTFKLSPGSSHIYTRIEHDTSSSFIIVITVITWGVATK